MANIFVIFGVLAIASVSMTGCRYTDEAGLHTSNATSAGTNQKSSDKPVDLGPTARELSKGKHEAHGKAAEEPTGHEETHH